MTDLATLLERNLQEIFGEGDDARRRKVAEEIMHEDAVFVEPRGVHSGRDEIVRIAGVIRAMHPTFRYAPITEAEVLHDRAGRVKWIAESRASLRSTPALTSSSQETARLPPSICFSMESQTRPDPHCRPDG